MPLIQQPTHAEFLESLLASYQHLLAKPLLQLNPQQTLAHQLFTAKFVLLAHNTEADPKFVYANQMALSLFEFNSEELIGLASRLSAEPLAQIDRQTLLDKVSQQGYIDNYAGVRISKTGKRFVIKNAIVWNIYDGQKNVCGQAACFNQWEFL